MTDFSMPSEFVPPWGIDYLPAAGSPGGNRYKVAWGGRGSSKSWTFSRIAIARMVHKPMRFLCARELQISIKDSVHHLLASQIEALNAGFYFEVGDSFIRTKAPGGEFLFRGLRHNASEIKSMEAIKICWVEEAQAVSEAQGLDEGFLHRRRLTLFGGQRQGELAAKYLIHVGADREFGFAEVETARWRRHFAIGWD